jgi:hypothetical protein
MQVSCVFTSDLFVVVTDLRMAMACSEQRDRLAPKARTSFWAQN